MISATEIDIRTEGEIAPENYLSDHSVHSWLLTTDHKRIGILYLFTIIIFFFIASVAAAMMRIELLTPQGDLVTSETYNKLFTIHGVLMVWFFLIPSIPAVLGNFMMPLMIGARDVAFPKLNLMSWYIFIRRKRAGTLVAFPRRRGYRLDVLHALQHHLLELARDLDGGGRFHCRVLQHHHRDEFHHHDPQNARARADVVPAAALCLVTVCNEPDYGAGHASAGDHARAHVGGTLLGRRHFRSETRRRPDSVPAPVLVLFASGRLHHDFAGHGRDQRIDHLFFAQTYFRLRLDCVRQHGDCHARVSWFGVITCL